MERDVADSERRTFTHWKGAKAGEVHTFTSTELCHMDNAEEALLAPRTKQLDLNVVGRRVTRSVQREVHEIRAEPADAPHTMSASQENAVLGHCCG